MADREKLIELQKHVLTKLPFPWCTVWRDVAEQIADQLIAYGVTVPAIPLGSTVYCLYCRGKRGDRNWQIASKKELDFALWRGSVIEVREKKSTKQDALLLGKVVFLTREEAEAAIKP